MFGCKFITLWVRYARGTIQVCDAIRSLPLWHPVGVPRAHANWTLARYAKRTGTTPWMGCHQDLMTIALYFRLSLDLARRGRSVPKAKQPSPTGVLLTAAPIALAA